MKMQNINVHKLENEFVNIKTIVQKIQAINSNDNKLYINILVDVINSFNNYPTSITKNQQFLFQLMQKLDIKFNQLNFNQNLVTSPINFLNQSSPMSYINIQNTKFKNNLCLKWETNVYLFAMTQFKQIIIALINLLKTNDLTVFIPTTNICFINFVQAILFFKPMHFLINSTTDTYSQSLFNMYTQFKNIDYYFLCSQLNIFNGSDFVKPISLFKILNMLIENQEKLYTQYKNLNMKFNKNIDLKINMCDNIFSEIINLNQFFLVSSIISIIILCMSQN